MPERLAQLAWLATVGLITWASLSPDVARGESAGAGRLLTNFGHVPAYALLTALSLRLVRAWVDLRYRVALAAGAVGLGLGALFEAVQPLVGRDGSFGDMTLNAAGVAVAIIAWYLVPRGVDGHRRLERTGMGRTGHKDGHRDCT